MSIQKLAAAGFDIHVFDAEELAAALDHCVDLPDGRGMEAFADLMIMKYMGIPPRMMEDLDTLGEIEQPVLVEVDFDGSWCFADGHHRLAWALVRKRPVPVMFSDGLVDEILLYDAVSQFDIFYDYVEGAGDLHVC